MFKNGVEIIINTDKNCSNNNNRLPYNPSGRYKFRITFVNFMWLYQVFKPFCTITENAVYIVFANLLNILFT